MQTSLNFCRRSILLLAPLALIAGVATAQSYPTKPIEWVVPYPAGGGSDVVARSLTEPMGKALGQPVIINNKPGAATNIGAEYVARAKADGYTLLTGDTATLAATRRCTASSTTALKKTWYPWVYWRVFR